MQCTPVKSMEDFKVGHIYKGYYFSHKGYPNSSEYHCIYLVLENDKNNLCLKVLKVFNFGLLITQNWNKAIAIENGDEFIC